MIRQTDNPRKKHLENAGYTLVELIVSMTLTALLATAVVAVMSPASRVFRHIQKLSRAQIVADSVIDALREECADTFIRDFASVRIVNTAPTSLGDADMLSSLAGITSDSENSGNVLVIRKTGGYCEAIFSSVAISSSNYLDVRYNDGAYKYENGISSRAVYRFFDGGSASAETNQGYVHYAYYQSGRSYRSFDNGSESVAISCIFPAVRYDYTNPFSVSAYSGYTVDISFSDLRFSPAPGESAVNLLTKRPESVMVKVRVYDCDYAHQTSDTPVYTREALLIFAEDNTAQ